MKVYITYKHDRDDGDEVDKVFPSEAAAQDHIIKTVFMPDRYENKKELHELQEMALDHITEHVIEPPCYA